MSGQESHKGRGFGTVLLAAPVTINGVTGNVAVMVKREASNVHKPHRHLMPDGLAFGDNEKAEPTPANRGPRKGVNPAPISSAKDSISQTAENRNAHINFLCRT